MLKENLSQVSLHVTEEVSVKVLPSANHEFLMATKEVARGYGVTDYNIRQHKLAQSTELIEGKHFISGVSIPHAAGNGSSIGTLWTKRGIIRLGFFIKSERAKLFRDWAEELIISVDENRENFLRPVIAVEAPKKRRHNRLTQDRMITILSDIAKIDDKELRLSLISKLGV